MPSGPDYHGWTHANGIDPIPGLTFADIGAGILRDGSAPALNVTSHALNQTTTLLDNWTHTLFNNNMTVDLTNGTISPIDDGHYLILQNATWVSSAGAYGACLGFDLNDNDGIVAPISSTYVWPTDDGEDSGAFIITLTAGDLINMNVGQNSGSNKPAPLATMFVYRLSASPIGASLVTLTPGDVDGGAP